MPYYNLLVVAEIRTLSDVARDRAEALVKFGATLGVRLTFEERGVAAPYLLDEWYEGPHWVNPTIPVFVGS